MLKKLVKKILRIDKKIKILSQPEIAVIETTNHCNLNCPFCMVGVHKDLIYKHGSAAHNFMRRPQGYMSEDTFLRVLQQLEYFGIHSVYLHFQGEPFLNTLTPQFARILKNHNFEVGIFTNGLAFNDRNVLDLQEAEIDLIRFSIDGASQESYAQNRVGGEFKQVLDNLRKIAVMHRGLKARVEWQFVVMRNNEHEVAEAKKIASEIGVTFILKKFRETDSARKPLNGQYHVTYHKKPCTDIYKQIGIYWNGDVVPCC